MKKKILIFLICLFSFPTICFAENKNVTFSVNFLDGIDANSFENIIVYYTDKSESEYSITLKKENNFYYSYDLYDGSDIERVKVVVDNDDIVGESSVLRNSNGYNIFIDIKKKSDDVLITDVKTTTKASEETTVSSENNSQDKNEKNQTSQIETTKTTSTKVYQETKQNKNIRFVYMLIASILGIFVVIFIFIAIIKIVNANK